MTMLDMIPFGVYYTHSFGYEEAKRGVVDAGSLSGCTPAVQRGDAKLFVETEALLALLCSDSKNMEQIRLKARCRRS